MIFTVVSFTLNATFKLTRRNYRVTFDDHFRRTISHKRDTIVSWVIWDFLKFFFIFFLFCFAKSFSSFFTISHTRFSYASKIKPCVLSSVNVKRWGLYYKAYWFGFVRQIWLLLHYMKMIHGKTQLVSLIKSNTCCEKKNYEHHFTWLANFLIRQWKRQ